MTNADAGWPAVPVVVLVGVLYIAIVSFVLGKSQAARNVQDQSQSKAA